MSLLSDSLKTAPSQVKDEAADDGAAIGRAALKKQREEATKSLRAVLASEADHGKAVRWERRVTVATNADTESGREIRKVAVWERAGAYGEREFLRLANRAAAAAVPNGWRNAEAVEAIGAEIVAKILTRTYGRMPKRGSLGTTTNSADPDFTYLVSCGRSLAGDIGRGDASGLAAEVRPMAAADGTETVSDLLSAATDQQAAADLEQNPEPYFYDPRPLPNGLEGPAAPVPASDFLTPQTRTAVKRLAVEAGAKPAAVIAAVVTAIRPNLRAADLAGAGYGKNAGALRTAASKGRPVLRGAIEGTPASARHWTAADWRLWSALADLLTEDAAPRRGERHISEETAHETYRARPLPEMPDSAHTQAQDEETGRWKVIPVDPPAWRPISAETLSSYPGSAR